MRVEGDLSSFPSASGCEGRRWTRGAFIVGCSAPVKINEGIKVHLRAGANEEVDFVIYD